jgi:hypothetical protein
VPHDDHDTGKVAVPPRAKTSMSRTSQRLAGWIADRPILPTAASAVFGYYAAAGAFDLESLRLRRLVEARTQAMVADVFDVIETAIAAEFDHPRESVTFEYDTKLVLPAELTLGQIYRIARARAAPGADPVALSHWAHRTAADGGETTDGANRYRDPLAPDGWDGEDLDPQTLVDRGEYLTRFVIEALIDGDMRDAVNDAEYEDFEVSLDLAPDERARMAALAQETLEADLATTFERVPDDVEATYEWAVEYSQAHQERDEYFRDLLADAQAGNAAAASAIRSEYKFRTVEDPTGLFSDDERDLPYLETQYARVGVIYDGMIDMYRDAGLPIDGAFKKSIVFAIIAAQIWLDDVEDFPADREDGQLTPVTAEYVLADSDRAAYDAIVDATEQYVHLARQYARRSDSPLTGIATEYIYRSGDPSVLPGSHG